MFSHTTYDYRVNLLFTWKCDTRLLLFLVIRLMSLKKILKILGRCVAPLLPPPLPLGKRNPNHSPPLRLPLPSPRSQIYISPSSSDPHPDLDLNPIQSFHLLLDLSTYPPQPIPMYLRIYLS